MHIDKIRFILYYILLFYYYAIVIYDMIHFIDFFCFSINNLQRLFQQRIPRLSQHSNVRHRACRNPPLIHTLRNIDQAHIL